MVQFHSNLGDPLKQGTLPELHQRLINEQPGTSYTIVAADTLPTTLRCTNAAAITVTFPTNATTPIPVGRIVEIVQGGAGRVSLAGAGITFVDSYGTKATREQNSKIYAQKIATDTWLISGDRLPPAFYAFANVSQSNVTGNSTAYTVKFQGESFDDGGVFSNSTTFTAPVAGLYSFDVGVRLDGLTAAADQAHLTFNFSSRADITVVYQDTDNMPEDMTLTASVTVRLAKNETVQIVATVFGEASDVVDVLNSNDPNITYFSGHLVQ